MEGWSPAEMIYMEMICFIQVNEIGFVQLYSKAITHKSILLLQR